jgi:hypothetical protein
MSNGAPRRVVVGTHGHCFDGLASATVFSRVFSHVHDRPVEFTYHALGYGCGQQAASEGLFTGDDNVILDYRFFPSERLTWYFDHHATAFATEADRSIFEEQKGSRQFFFDPSFSSCTRLVAQIAQERFECDLEELAEVIRWADRIDSASFANPNDAIDRSHPVMQLASVVEQYCDDDFLNTFVPLLLSRPLAEVAELGRVKQLYRPLRRRFERFAARVERRAQPMGRTVYVDLSDEISDTFGKFITYALYPQAQYSVVLVRMKNALKISVGHNPWSGSALDNDISALCARHGGGGHRYVGGIAFPPSDLTRAQTVAKQLVAELEQSNG